MFNKNPTPPPAYAPIPARPAVNGVLTSPTPTHTQPSISTLTTAASLTTTQYKFCVSTLRYLKKAEDAQPFLAPIDIAPVNVPHYPEIISQHMDFSTIESKTDFSDIDNQHRKRLLFLFRFLGLIALALGIAETEKQIEAMRGTISVSKQQKKKPPKKAAHQQPTPSASSSKPAKSSAPSSKKVLTTKKSSEKSAAVPGDNDILTFDREDLYEAIRTLDGQKLERVIRIILKGVPEDQDVRRLHFLDSEGARGLRDPVTTSILHTM